MKGAGCPELSLFSKDGCGHEPDKKLPSPVRCIGKEELKSLRELTFRDLRKGQ